MKNLKISSNTSSSNIDRNIEILSIITNLVKSKKLDLIKFIKLILAKSKKSDLLKFKKTNLLKNFVINIVETDFLIFRAKKAFIYLWQTFTNILILKYFNLEYHIYIETNTLRYVISRVLSQIT